MTEIKKEDMHVAQVYRVSRMEYEFDPKRFEHFADNHMREAIANFIQHERAVTTVEDNFIERRIDLYVATPAQFWALVHKEAQEIALRFAPR